MSRSDPHQAIYAQRAIFNVSPGDDVNGLAIDTQGADYCAFFVMTANTNTQVGDFTIQESADGSTGWVAVSADALSIDTDSDGTVAQISTPTRGHERYLRLAYAYNAGASAIAAIAVLSGLDRPVSEFIAAAANVKVL